MTWHFTILKSYLCAQVSIRLNDPTFFKPQISAAIAGEKKDTPSKKSERKKRLLHLLGASFPLKARESQRCFLISSRRKLKR